MEIKLTADGSHTLFVAEIEEHYHSVNGAIQESKHVYIDAGFNQCIQKEIRVLELGFGTGLNAFLTCLEAEKRNVSVSYTGLEKFPLPLEIAIQLNYGETFFSPGITLFRQIHTSKWEMPEYLNSHFTLLKVNTDFTIFDFKEMYDVVYYDAFAPDKQEDVWSQSIFNRIFAAMNEGGILTTYCAKGSIRRMMQQAGFMVERIPGPPGKREMLRARKVLLPNKHPQEK